MFLTLIDKCRFCFNEIVNEENIKINQTIINQFSYITSKELILSPKLSILQCKDCNEKITAFYNYKQDLIEKQENLSNLLNLDAEKGSNSLEKSTCEDMIELVEQIDDDDDSETMIEIETEVKKDPFESSSDNFINVLCLQCNKKFTSEKKLKTHVQRMHNTTRKCEYCDFTASQKNELYKHVKANHVNKLDNSLDLRICAYCGKILKGNNHLNFHIKTKHLKLTKFSCDLCPFKSYGKYEIRSHITIHHLPLELRKGFKCDLCPSVLTTQMSLKTHFFHKHSGLKPHKCFCGKSYALKETLKSHIRNVHNLERKYKCAQCNKGFNSNSRLNDHINNTHGEKQKIPCNECGKIFNSQRNLQTHKIYHFPPKLKCNYNNCEKMFYIKKNLREHEQSIHMGVTYQCESCQRTFQSTSGLRRHSKSHCNILKDNVI